MEQDRKVTQSGGVYIVSLHLRGHPGQNLTDKIDLLRDCVRLGRKLAPFDVTSASVSADHAQMVWTLPVGDTNLLARFNLVRSTFARHCGWCDDQRPVWQWQSLTQMPPVMSAQDDFASPGLVGAQIRPSALATGSP